PVQAIGETGTGPKDNAAPVRAAEVAAGAGWKGWAAHPARGLARGLQPLEGRGGGWVRPQAKQAAGTGPETAEEDTTPEDADRPGDQMGIGQAGTKDAAGHPQDKNAEPEAEGTAEPTAGIRGGRLRRTDFGNCLLLLFQGLFRTGG